MVWYVYNKQDLSKYSENNLMCVYNKQDSDNNLSNKRENDEEWTSGKKHV